MQLRALARKHPDVTRSGFTTTDSGQWALKLWLREDAHAPLPDIERERDGSAVIYAEEPEYRPVARPAFPARGE